MIPLEWMPPLMFGGLVVELQGDEYALHGPQQPDGAAANHDRPQQDMYPDGRLDSEFQPDRERCDNGAQNHDDEDRRTVAAIGGFEVGTAFGAGLVE